MSRYHSNKEIYTDARWKELFAFGKDLFMIEWNRLRDYSLSKQTAKFRVRKHTEEETDNVTE